MSNNNEPRSIRLTKAHRQDMVDAVIKQWEITNPPPSKSNKLNLIKAVVDQIKKHPSVIRTEKLTKVLDSNDWRHTRLECNFNIQIMDSENHVRNTVSSFIPHSFAVENGIACVPKEYGLTCSVANKFLESDYTKYDISVKGNVREYDQIYVATFIEQNYPTVIISDSSPEYLEYRESNQKFKNWEKERDQLRNEVTDLLDQFNTTKQIRENWEEMVPYLPPHIADPEQSVKLPVLAKSRLNERLGI